MQFDLEKYFSWSPIFERDVTHGKVLLCYEYELNIHIISGSKLRMAQYSYAMK